MKTEHKIILYRTLINAIQSMQDCSHTLRKELTPHKYACAMRGMVRGIGFTMQELAVCFGHDPDKMHGSVIWVYLLICRDRKADHIDMSIGTALGNAKTSYKNAQEQKVSEDALCTI